MKRAPIPLGVAHGAHRGGISHQGHIGRHRTRPDPGAWAGAADGRRLEVAVDDGTASGKQAARRPGAPKTFTGAAPAGRAAHATLELECENCSDEGDCAPWVATTRSPMSSPAAPDPRVAWRFEAPLRRPALESQRQGTVGEERQEMDHRSPGAGCRRRLVLSLRLVAPGRRPACVHLGRPRRRSRCGPRDGRRL